MMNIKLLLISTKMIITLSARPPSSFDISVAPTLPIHTECSGSLVIETKPGKQIRASSSRKNTSLNVRSAHIDGCGCYYLYKRPGFRSSSRLIHPAMRVVNEKYISFRVHSIEKVPCEQERYWFIYKAWAGALKNNSQVILQKEKKKEEEIFEINLTYAWDSVVLIEGLLKSICQKSSDLSCTIVYPVK